MNLANVKVLVSPSTMFANGVTTQAINFNDYKDKTLILECGAGTSANSTLTVEGTKENGSKVAVPFLFGEVGGTTTKLETKAVPVGSSRSYAIGISSSDALGCVSVVVKMTKITSNTTVGSLTMIETNPRYAG